MPLALLASSNPTPAWLHQPVRRLLDGCRAINEMVFALLRGRGRAAAGRAYVVCLDA